MMLEPLKPKAHQPVLVRENESPHVPTRNGVHDVEKTLASKVQPAADLLDPFDIYQPPRRREPFKDAPLLLQVWLLCRR